MLKYHAVGHSRIMFKIILNPNSIKYLKFIISENLTTRKYEIHKVPYIFLHIIYRTKRQVNLFLCDNISMNIVKSFRENRL